MVVFMLEANGFEVYNLGVDVPPEKFVRKIKETGGTIVGLSGFLTLAFPSRKVCQRKAEEAYKARVTR
ncbi:MAG: cobalamin-dependent protein [Candidatus Micrarchaeia archaeon]